MSFRIPTDFCDTARSSSGLSFPAPGNSRSMTNFGTVHLPFKDSFDIPAVCVKHTSGMPVKRERAAQAETTRQTLLQTARRFPWLARGLLATPSVGDWR